MRSVACPLQDVARRKERRRSSRWGQRFCRAPFRPAGAPIHPTLGFPEAHARGYIVAPPGCFTVQLGLPVFIVLHARSFGHEGPQDDALLRKARVAGNASTRVVLAPRWAEATGFCTPGLRPGLHSRAAPRLKNDDVGSAPTQISQFTCVHGLCASRLLRAE